MNDKISVPFNHAAQSGNELNFIRAAMTTDKLSGGGAYTLKSELWLQQYLHAEAVFLVPSCTAALEFSALLLDIQPDDEIIVPSFTFVSSATAFVLFGAKIVYADVDPNYFSLNIESVERLINEKTKAIVCVDYAGFCNDLIEIRALADKYGICLVEDAAQALGSSIQNRRFGSLGHLATISFHETKNVTSGGEGGALVINDVRYIERAHVIRDKGTNRKRFIEGFVDKYSWVDKGSSYLMNEISAAYLYAQFESFQSIQYSRHRVWQQYKENLSYLAYHEDVRLCSVPDGVEGNAHIFYVVTPKRPALLSYLRQHGIEACFHYTPLHLSEAGMRYGQCKYPLPNAELAGAQLLRLPLSMWLSEEKVNFVCSRVIDFFRGS